MKTIIEERPEIRRLFITDWEGKTEFRMMKYTIRADCEDGVLLHNAITGKLILLSGDEAASLNRMDFEDDGLREALIRDCFLAPSDWDEAKLVLQLRRIMKVLFRTTAVDHFVVLTTTHCNARCYYCFENNYRRINMSEKTAAQVAEYIENACGGRSVSIKWFGGEPLANHTPITGISTLLTEKGVQFSSGITTNGYLFTDELISMAVRVWRLRNVQITLDGTEDVYNRTKAFIGVSGSPYQRVMGNIKKLLDAGLNVIIRLNLDKNNGVDLNLLIDELNESFGQYQNVCVAVSTIIRNLGFDPVSRNQSEHMAIYRTRSELNEKLHRLGLRRPEYYPHSIKSVACSADNDKNRVIFPDGTLYACDVLREDEPIGSIWSPTVNESAIQAFHETIERPACPSCPLYPGCIQLKRCAGLETMNEISCGDLRTKAVRGVIELYRQSRKNA